MLILLLCNYLTTFVKIGILIIFYIILSSGSKFTSVRPLFENKGAFCPPLYLSYYNLYLDGCAQKDLYLNITEVFYFNKNLRKNKGTLLPLHIYLCLHFVYSLHNRNISISNMTQIQEGWIHWECVGGRHKHPLQSHSPEELSYRISMVTEVVEESWRGDRWVTHTEVMKFSLLHSASKDW